MRYLHAIHGREGIAEIDDEVERQRQLQSTEAELAALQLPNLPRRLIRHEVLLRRRRDLLLSLELTPLRTEADPSTMTTTADPANAATATDDETAEQQGVYLPDDGKRAARAWMEQDEETTAVPAACVLRDDHTAAATTTTTVAASTFDHCRQCQVELKVANRQGLLICESCGFSKTYNDVTSNAMPFKPPSDTHNTTFSYKRINHFEEWLLQIQGKENFDIPDEVIARIREVLSKQRIEGAAVTVRVIRETLKALKLSAYYHHTSKICGIVSGIPQPVLDPAIEEQAKLMFIAVQEPFSRFRPDSRRNFLSYSYVLFKLLEQLCPSSPILEQFMLLKGKDKLERQDQIWERICESLQWPFTPSV